MSIQAFQTLANSKLKFGLFLFAKLPSAWFSGVKIKSINKEQCITTVPYKWLTQNPFKSTYFASQAMAAELSTGALAMMYIYKITPGVSMLVVSMKAQYFKKAVGTTIFTCTQGAEFETAIKNAISQGTGQTVTATSHGTNAQGEVIASFEFEWSFKAKKG
jgi:hypothetical protein